MVSKRGLEFNSQAIIVIEGDFLVESDQVRASPNIIMETCMKANGNLEKWKEKEFFSTKAKLHIFKGAGKMDSRKVKEY